MGVGKGSLWGMTGQREHAGTPPAILVVEDRSDDAELLADMLRRSKILNPIRIVGTVEDAVCYLKGEGIYENRQKYPFPILVLLDLHLPDGTGFDVLRWVQAHRTQSPNAVVVLTGSDIHAVQRAYTMGAHSFLVKPLRFEDFQNMANYIRGIKLVTAKNGQSLEADGSAS